MSGSHIVDCGFGRSMTIMDTFEYSSKLLLNANKTAPALLPPLSASSSSSPVQEELKCAISSKDKDLPHYQYSESWPSRHQVQLHVLGLVLIPTEFHGAGQWWTDHFHDHAGVINLVVLVLQFSSRSLLQLKCASTQMLSWNWRVRKPLWTWRFKTSP